MPFPETRQTLIERLSQTGDEADWRQFMLDYWGPVCRFAASRAGISNAEDVASLTFEALITNQLLARWIRHREAKLRTLICSVVRNILSNRMRIEQGRARLIRTQPELLARSMNAESSDDSELNDAFYAAWVNDLLEQVIQKMWRDYHSSGRSDYFRVLYGKICEGLSMPELAQALSLPVSTVENYFKAAKKQLTTQLQELVQHHVACYGNQKDQDQEFQAEWGNLGEYLTSYGGLEQVIQHTMEQNLDFGKLRRKQEGVEQTLVQSFAHLRREAAAKP